MKQVIVITGGAGGMGFATAKLLGASGYHVIISDVNQQKLDEALHELQSQNISAQAVVCDITKRPSVDELVAAAQTAGSIIGVVHSAGVSPLMGKPDFIININAVGTVHITEAFLAVAQEGFSLVNVASIAGHMTPSLFIPKRTYKLAFTHKRKFAKKLTQKANFSPKKMRSGQAYSLSKNFVIWYSQQMAQKFGKKGARIVSVSPGSFDTSMGRLEEKSGSGKLVEYTSLQRFGKPEEVGELLAFLASGKAGYITGTDILIDGGAKAALTPKAMLSMTRDSLKS